MYTIKNDNFIVINESARVSINLFEYQINPLSYVQMQSPCIQTP